MGSQLHRKPKSPIATLWLHHCTIVMALSAWPSAGAERTHGSETDRIALLEFKANVVDSHGVLSSWNSSQQFCQWFGVTCDPRHRRIVTLDVQSQQLSGTISSYIGNLSFMRVLHLQNNSFHSEIPPELGYLSRLQYLYLNNNSLNGSIPPSLSRCSNLFIISLGNNKLEGQLPSNLSSLSNLWKLLLRNNYLSGEIPLSFGNLSYLEYVDMTLNNLSGRIPYTLGNLRNLKALALGGNDFAGNFPSSLTNISSLEALDLADNRFTGVLPWDLGFTLPNLQYFSVSGNQFSGTIPKSTANMSQLFTLSLTSNRFTGNVPSFENLINLSSLSVGDNHLGTGEANDTDFLCSLTNSSNLYYLDIALNNLGGAIPNCIGNLSDTVEAFVFENNPLSGTLPGSMGNLINLELLLLFNTTISGTIPPEIGNLKRLKLLYLANSEFTGEIPHTIGNLSMLIELFLAGNNLVGTIPSSLGHCQSLLLLDLSNNKLTGTIPPEIMSLTSLSVYADFSKNNLSGKLPVEIGNLKNLGILYLHENQFFGVIPSSLGDCISLEHLYMNHNMFTGLIPSTLSSLKGMRILSLSHNRLTGKIPDFLESLNLTSLDLSYNNFEGELPRGGVFTNVSATSVLGNVNLCGGLPEYRLPKCKDSSRSSTDRSAKFKLVICMVSAIFATILVISLVYGLRKRKHMKTSAPTPSNSNDGFLKVSYQDLLKATDGFSSANLIGTGSFGSVYKGVFPLDKTPVAVKVFNLGHHGASKSFAAECEVLRNIRHRNLVKVLTACSGCDYNGNGFKALVYEFMINGNLDEWLHPPTRKHVKQRDMPQQLGLVHRLNIASDVACALDYLHHQCERQVVHCDLKPSNVLISGEMTAHVGDFGLVRFMPEVTSELNSGQTRSIGVEGSIGYIAPEYGAGGEVSSNGDVYSFGILLLEMFTGKRPTDDMFIDGLTLHSYAQAAYPERVLEIIDPVLLKEIQEEEISNSRSQIGGGRLHAIRECLLSIIKVGLVCSSEVPRDRMRMSDAAATLQAIRKKLTEFELV